MPQLANMENAASLGFQQGRQMGEGQNPLGQFIRGMLQNQQQSQAIGLEYGMKKGIANTEMAEKFALEKYKTELNPPGYQPKTMQEKIDMERGIYQARGKNITDASDLSSEQQLQGRALARKIYGVRGAEFGVPAVYEEMRKGKTVDQIEDNLRYSGQSKEFAPIRDAAQSILINANPINAQTSMDYVDDFVGRKDAEGAKQALKRLARTNAGAEESRNIVGKERTISLLTEIQEDLNKLEKMGINTNLFTGTQEQVAAKVGTVVNPEARKVATKISTAVQNYRRSMTGVQFGMPENREYKVMFPNIGRTANFNTANINALKEVMKGDLDNFYSLSMGENSYKKLFNENNPTDLSNLSDDELRKIIAGGG